MTDQRGQVTILVLGLTLVCMAVSGLAIDGTRLMLHRRNLQNQADAAALAGASQIDTDIYYGSEGLDLRLDPHRARARALEMLELVPRATRVAIEVTRGSVVVGLTTSVAPTFLGIAGIGPMRVTVESRAEPVPGSA